VLDTECQLKDDQDHQYDEHRETGQLDPSGDVREAFAILRTRFISISRIDVGYLISSF
jgi:hypothetical protein